MTFVLLLRLAAPAPASPTPVPVTQPILTAWQAGDRAAAIRDFAEADWQARPLFAKGLALSLSEDEFKSLPAIDHQLQAGELPAQLDLLKQLAEAMVQAGQAAAARGDSALARKDFIALQHCGAALDQPDRLRRLQLTGRIMKSMGGKELAKLGK